MDPGSPAVSKIVFAIQSAQEVAQYASASHIFSYTRLLVSTLLALPSLFSHPLVRFITPLLLSFMMSALALSYSFSNSGTSDQSTTDTSAPAIRILSKVLIPTSSIWPERYLDTTHSAELQGRNCILIKLETLFRDIKQGLVELRNPSSDLPLLIKGQLLVDVWNIKLDLSLKDRAKTWAWILSDELSHFPDETSPKPCTIAEEKLAPVDLTVLEHYCSLFYEETDDMIVWPALDIVPRAFIQRCIRSTQQALQAKPSVYRTSVLSFTTTETGLTTFNDTFVYVALPFSRILSSKDAQKKTLRVPRSSAPLFTRLSDILALLTSGRNALRVLSLSNVSATYANALDDHATGLEYNAAARSECIKAVGVQGWREERLYARWEAALLRAGLLTRWVVLLEVKE